MAKVTKTEKMHNRYIVPIITGSISAIIGGISVAIIVSFLKISPLENKIDEQKLQIQKLEHNITTINTTLQEQNIGVKFDDQAKVDMINQQSGGTGNTQTNTYKNE